MNMSNQYNSYDPQQSRQVYAPMPEPGSGQALAGVILGGIGLIAWLLPLIGYPVAIVGLVLSIKGQRSFSHRTMATVGVVLSAIALALTVISSIIGVALLSQS